MLSVFCSVFPGLKNYKKKPFHYRLIHTNLSKADIESG